MPKEEQVERNTALQKRLVKYNQERWARDFINSLEGIKKLQETNYTRKVNTKITRKLIDEYQKAGSRMIFLDYDGTLTGFHKDPQKAIPNEELYDILDRLLEDDKNTIVIISGRDKETLSRWFQKQGQLAMIAEHGVFHAKIHFSSGRCSIWLMDDPYSYRILTIDDILDPDLSLAYPWRSYTDKATVTLEQVKACFKQFKRLRYGDETIYLRSASINIINGMIGLTFSCDGSHYMPVNDFLEKEQTFWFGVSSLEIKADS